MRDVPLTPELGEDAVAQLAALYAEVGDGLYFFLWTDPDFGRRVREALGSYLAGWAECSDGWERDLSLEADASALIGGLTWWYEHHDAVSVKDLAAALRPMPYAMFHAGAAA